MQLSGTRVGLRCDGTPAMGVGHAVRCLALAQELQQRGAEVTLLGEVTVPWVQGAYDERGIRRVAAAADAPGLAHQAGDLGLDAVVLDGYDIAPGAGRALADADVAVLAMVDGPYGAAQHADVYVDQNLGAPPPANLPPGAVALTDLEHALFRDNVLARRAAPRAPHEPPRVLAVFGGTDPCGAAPVVVPLLLGTGLPLTVTVVAPDPAVRRALADLPTGPGQQIEAVGPLPDLPAQAVESDLVLSASGSSVWELLCLGVPTAVVCVVDNQRMGYAETVARGVVAGLGQLDQLRADPGARRAAVGVLTELLSDPAARRGHAMRGQSLVDGQGRRKVIDALARVLRERAQHQ